MNATKRDRGVARLFFFFFFFFFHAVHLSEQWSQENYHINTTLQKYDISGYEGFISLFFVLLIS